LDRSKGSLIRATVCVDVCMQLVRAVFMIDMFLLLLRWFMRALAVILGFFVEDRVCERERERVREFVPNCKTLVCFIW
jgi:hypothetical protein